MGAAHSLPNDICLDDFLNDLHSFYPGFEEQLEDAYEACTGLGDPDCIQEGVIYHQVEPIMRHFLFQMGLGELLPRVCDHHGALKVNAIMPMLHAAGIHLDTNKRLNLDDWKILVIAWVRRLQEEQVSDLETWHSLLDRMQADQEQKYHISLQNFQSAYIDQIEEYHRAVEAQHQQEEEYKRQWENNNEMQTRFHDSQQEYVARMNELAEKNFAGRSIISQQTQFLDQLQREASKVNIVPFDGASRVFSFMYPTGLTSVGAPISGGALMPHPRQDHRCD